MALLAWMFVPLLLLLAVPHELAHLAVARRFGITVQEYGIGLPPRAWSRQWKGIRWTICWLLPFGAFVRLKGEDGGNEPDDFAAHPAWQRALVVLAGPAANFTVAALAVAISLLLIGRPAGTRLEVADVLPGSPAALADVRPGDVVLTANGQKVESAQSFLRLVVPGQPLAVLLQRGDAIQETWLQVPVDASHPGQALGLTTARRMVYAPLQAPAPERTMALRPLSAAAPAAGQTSAVSPGAATAVVGWVGLAQVMDELAGLGISPLAWFLALLATFSLSLGLMNLLPLPPLDGSRAFLCLLEGVSRRPVATPRVLNRVNVAGFVVLLGIFAIVTGTDVFRLLQSQPILPVQ